MKAIEEKLRQREAELKKLDEAKRDRESRKQRDEELAQEQARAKKIKEKEDEERKRKMLIEDQARKIQEAHLKRQEEIAKLKRDEVQRKQVEEQKRKEEQRRAEERAIKQRIEKQVEKSQVSAPQAQPQPQPQKKEGTDINAVIRMAAQNVQQNIMNIEKQKNIPTPKPQEQMPAIEVPKARVHPPQSAKPRNDVQIAPPQSARQNVSASEWMKKQASPRVEQQAVQEKPQAQIRKPIAGVALDPEEKTKREAERRKQREEFMKNWNEKWKKREEKTNFVKGGDVSPTAAPLQDAPTPKIQNSRNIEQVQVKQVAQTVENWMPKNENKGLELPKIQGHHMKSPLAKDVNKVEFPREILKEKSPQPVRHSPQKEKLQYKENLQEERKEKSVSPAPQLDPEDMIPQDDDPKEYKDVYNMLSEMMELVKGNLNSDSPNSDEEEKKSLENSDGRYDDDEDDDSDDDGFGEDRDTNWEGARMRKKSKSPIRSVRKAVVKPQQATAPQVLQQRPIFEESLQTIPEAQSDAENTFAGSKQRPCTPSNVQDSSTRVSEDSGEDREDMFEESQGDQIAINNQGGAGVEMRPEFTFMGNDPGQAAVFEQISRFTSVEEYRDFLEKELGEEKLMRAYPILKDFGDNILFFEKVPELERILSGVLSLQEIRKYQPHFATWIFMEMQAETPDMVTGQKLGSANAMKTLKNINLTANFGAPILQAGK